jgi:hypothetical protein
MGRGAAVSGLITAAILGPVWWNVYTFGEASVRPALPFIYGSVLTLLVCSLWRAYWRGSFHSPATQSLPAEGEGRQHPAEQPF